MKKLGLQLCALIMSCGCSWFPPSAVHPIAVGDVEIDPSTPHTIGLSLPILDGDQDFDASVRVAYRNVDSETWREALPLQRVRTDTLSQMVPTSFPIAEQFAGSIFDLSPGSAYEVRLMIEDPDGGTAMRTVKATTRTLPREAPRSPRVVHVDSDEALSNALARATSGDVITLGRGRYHGPFHIEGKGTEEDPIVVKGSSREGTTIDSPGAEYGVRIAGAHVHLEDLTIRSSVWASSALSMSSSRPGISA